MISSRSISNCDADLKKMANPIVSSESNLVLLKLYLETTRDPRFKSYLKHIQKDIEKYNSQPKKKNHLYSTYIKEELFQKNYLPNKKKEKLIENKYISVEYIKKKYRCKRGHGEGNKIKLSKWNLHVLQQPTKKAQEPEDKLSEKILFYPSLVIIFIKKTSY